MRVRYFLLVSFFSLVFDVVRIKHNTAQQTKSLRQKRESCLCKGLSKLCDWSWTTSDLLFFVLFSAPLIPRWGCAINCKKIFLLLFVFFVWYCKWIWNIIRFCNNNKSTLCRIFHKCSKNVYFADAEVILQMKQKNSAQHDIQIAHHFKKTAKWCLRSPSTELTICRTTNQH